MRRDLDPPCTKWKHLTERGGRDGHTKLTSEHFGRDFSSLFHLLALCDVLCE